MCTWDIDPSLAELIAVFSHTLRSYSCFDSPLAVFARTGRAVVGLLTKFALACVFVIAWDQLSLLLGADYWFISITGWGTILLVVTSILHVISLICLRIWLSRTLSPESCLSHIQTMLASVLVLHVPAFESSLLLFVDAALAFAWN
jgi:hypothetical protein